MKIAFSSLAFFHPSEVLTDDFDPIRRFVIEGEGVRKIIWMGAADDQIKNEVSPPLRHESGNYYAIRFRLYSADFIVDLSPDMRLFQFSKRKPLSYTVQLGGAGYHYDTRVPLVTSYEAQGHHRMV